MADASPTTLNDLDDDILYLVLDELDVWLA
jgi:hypothetical protein